MVVDDGAARGAVCDDVSRFLLCQIELDLSIRQSTHIPANQTQNRPIGQCAPALIKLVSGVGCGRGSTTAPVSARPI